MSAATSARWARIGTRLQPAEEQDHPALARTDSGVSRTSSFGRTASRGFRRAPSRQAAPNWEAAAAPRPKMSAGMLQLLTAGAPSRFRARPSTACARRAPPETDGVSPRIGSPEAVPDWMRTGLPSSMQPGSVGSLGTEPTSPVLSSPLLKRGMTRKSFRGLGTTGHAGSEALLDFLHALPLLSHLPRERLALLVPAVTSRHEKFGAVLERENERTENITIIWNGMVAVECKVLNATTCEEVPILSSCMRRPGQSKTLVPDGEDADSRTVASKASLVTGKGGRGTVLGAFASFFDTTSTETVRVESVGGAHVLSVPAAAVLDCCDEKAVAMLKERVRQLSVWRQGQASNMSASMTAAAYHYAVRHETHVPFPSTHEIKSINRKAREDIWHPLGWRKKLEQQEELERAAADLAMENRTGASKKSQKTATLRRPASALAGSTSRRRESRHDQKQAQVGVESITDRNLFLATWLQPEQHRVHLGSGVRGDSAAANGLHLELDIDAIKDLDGNYLANLQ